jgi:hypothetical protein
MSASTIAREFLTETKTRSNKTARTRFCCKEPA